MASGCILGDCPLCGELVWEDEAGWDDDLEICHETCLEQKILWRSVHDKFVLIAVRKNCTKVIGLGGSGCPSK